MSISGVLIIDKPTNLTSHDVVARVRRRLGTRKVGHAGTLDPDATGVLVVCVGDATRLLEYMVFDDKIYTGITVFGVGTDTDDATGRVLATASASQLTKEAVEEAAKALTGEIAQQVPAFSAVHIDGRRAYDLARAGADFDLPIRTVNIEYLHVNAFRRGNVAEADFRVSCSKGTYVRALCRDWGKALGVPAHLKGLRRVVSGPFRVEEAVSLADFEQAVDPESYLRPLTVAMRGMPEVRVGTEEVLRLAQGQRLSLYQLGAKGITSEPMTVTSGPVAVYGPANQFVGVCEWVDVNGRFSLKPKKVLWKREAGETCNRG